MEKGEREAVEGAAFVGFPLRSLLTVFDVVCAELVLEERVEKWMGSLRTGNRFDKRGRCLINRFYSFKKDSP
jgi:hypothetical protein